MIITQKLRLLLIAVLFISVFIKSVDSKKKKKVYCNHYFEYQQKRELLLEKLQNEKRKLRVCFLVSENEKWNGQSLYDTMEKSDDFYPFVVVTRLKNIKGRTSFKQNLEFYRNTCKNVYIGYDEENHKSIDIKKFKPDIIFYQQPWHIYKNQSPKYALDFALSYYFPYGVGSVDPVLREKFNSFYLLLQKHFVFSEAEKKQCMKFCKYVEQNTSVVGHPKFDNVYNDYDENKSNKNYVIYAPHHSFYPNSLLHYGTFDWNGKFILEWAKSHPELNWVIKPHPALKNVLLRKKIMTEKQIKEYYNEWAKIGKFYDGGDYFDLFKNSTCLITDCHSFLTEYFPTKKPVIHLRNRKGKNYSANSKEIMKTYYDVWNIKQLRSALEEVLIKKHDPKRAKRLNLLDEMKIGQENSSDLIIRELRKEFKRYQTVITYGTFDVLDKERILLLKKAKELGNYLIVGLSTDEFNQMNKKKWHNSYEQRKTNLEASEYVDLVIPKNNWEHIISDLNDYKVDVFIMGNNYPNKFDYLKDYSEVIYLEKSPNVCINERRNYLI